jgi:ABC-type multidrug transport system fused ATPase/permease subunit
LDKAVHYDINKGCGKSTLFKLITRMQDTSSGKIIIDGQNVQQVNLESLRKCIGVVLQDSMLFHSSCGENIQYGNLDAPFTHVEKAAELACISSIIHKFPNGYNSSVGERGMKVFSSECLVIRW